MVRDGWRCLGQEHTPMLVYHGLQMIRRGIIRYNALLKLCAKSYTQAHVSYIMIIITVIIIIVGW